ncbi:M1 family metallopeptidase [Sediminibacterium ginsengisoli]|uniref:Peptidase family M1 n=1 Tax=Sediminibacterium ginsengisoli TaxID=413434 RepID=A0A1T4PN12_9BACT|nr:M1 family metallopeptidase [Sediminibacterium ginsengisoli]SJZ92943.1 Peptidase family M1 [Sediminibacterium ginsengisoli]
MMNAKYTLPIMLCLLCGFYSVAQTPLSSKTEFTHADTLRGSITPERAWWDVLHYTIGITPDYNSRTITGTNAIRFKVLRPGRKMQIDLQQPMELVKASAGTHASLPFERNGNVYYISFPSDLQAGATETLLLEFRGAPVVARRPPWDGGWIFTKDKQGRPWMSVACQGLGASVWYPCKDHQSDEPDNGAMISITVPDTLVAVANGRLTSKQAHTNHTTTYQWTVVNPINNYNIVPYIGKYVNWNETYDGEKGQLDCSYWVLDYELQKAKQQFTQVKQMLHCFEYWMGPYPFYEDGYKLVQAPHLGMEHQSAVAYGNQFMNGYLGRDLSGTGLGMLWDFIIIHESGHEWFANNITSKDIADMWIHEGFTNYSETLFTECLSGKAAGDTYTYGIRRNINNDVPVTGPYGVNKEGSGDMYPKGSNMIHTIRQAMHNDSLFRTMLRHLNKRFYHQTVTAGDIMTEMSKFAGWNLKYVFQQYLHTVQVPQLEYYFSGDRKKFFFRWSECVKGFDLPLYLNAGSDTIRISPSETWKSITLTPGMQTLLKPEAAEKLYYIRVKNTSGNN